MGDFVANQFRERIFALETEIVENSIDIHGPPFTASPAKKERMLVLIENNRWCRAQISELQAAIDIIECNHSDYNQKLQLLLEDEARKAKAPKA